MTLAPRHRIGGLLAAALVVALVTAAPAAADPARPTHYRSTIDAVRAADGGPVPIAVEVLGGDAFLVLEAAPGVLVEVPGYEGEPYLRFEPDGRVLVNERSPARWLNDARYGAVGTDVPVTADAEAPPAWVPVADGGVYGWHDHRIHFMSPVVPRQVDPAGDRVQPVFDWVVPLAVDGRDVEVAGELAWVPGSSPLLPGVVVVLLAALVRTLWGVRPGAAAVTIGVTALAALAAGLAASVGLPPGVDGRPDLVAIPTVALVLVAVGALAGRSRSRIGRLVVLAGGIPLVVWGVLEIGALTRPIVPGALPLPATRAVTAAALGVGAAAVLAAVSAARAARTEPPAGGPSDRGP